MGFAAITRSYPQKDTPPETLEQRISGCEQLTHSLVINCFIAPKTLLGRLRWLLTGRVNYRAKSG